MDIDSVGFGKRNSMTFDGTEDSCPANRVIPAIQGELMLSGDDKKI